jgi:hypothetical protein
MIKRSGITLLILCFTLIGIVACSSEVNPSNIKSTAKQIDDRSDNDYMESHEALQIAKKFEPNKDVKWETEFKENYQADTDRNEVGPVWIVKGTFPLGNQVHLYIDALTKELVTMSEEETPDFGEKVGNEEPRANDPSETVPEQVNITVTYPDGNQQEYPGLLYQSQSHPFYMYLLPGYGVGIDGGPVNKFVRVYAFDDPSFMDIEVFPGNADLQSLIDESKVGLQSFGGVVNEDFSKRNSKFYHNATILSSKKGEEGRVVVTLPIQGTAYRVTMTTSSQMTETAAFYAMLETISSEH